MLKQKSEPYFWNFTFMFCFMIYWKFFQMSDDSFPGTKRTKSKVNLVRVKTDKIPKKICD